MFSKTSEYGMRAMIFIAKCSNSGLRASVDDIVDETNTPKPFISKILQVLVKEGLLESTKGPNGGFVIKKKKTTLAQIIQALEGREFFTGCALGLSRCSSKNPCPVHDQFMHIRDLLTKTLIESSLSGIVEKLENGKYKIK
ncbi:MAG: Rrf2 family transcriptional regulator [Bacteroidia bacterium]|nr:Rrf2 family transcriptional regulator [Bacteroidia bacterium]